MKILTSTPVRHIKDYAMEKWLENVSQLLREYPTDFLMIDNSPGLGYMKKVRGYCAKHGVKNYKIKHLELPPEQDRDERIARSREIIRKEILSKNYDAWFSWENDVIIPTNTLDELVKLLCAGDFMMVNHNNWERRYPGQRNFDWGVALIRKEALEKYGFILELGTDPDMPDTWEPAEKWFKIRVLRGGDGFIEVDGLIKPIYHLTDGSI